MLFENRVKVIGNIVQTQLRSCMLSFDGTVEGRVDVVTGGLEFGVHD